MTFDRLMVECETNKPCVARRHLDTCSWKVWRKSIERKWQKWCVVHVTKKQRLCDPFFALPPKPVERFRWKCARLSFQAATPPAKFNPNLSKFPRFISENDLPDRYNNRRSPIINVVFYHSLDGSANIYRLTVLPLECCLVDGTELCQLL